MRKRMFQMLAVVLVFVGAVGFIKFQQIKTAIAAHQSFQMPPEAVTTIVTQRQPWATTIEAVGSVAPMQGVTLSADLPGVVDRIAFESGARVNAGDPLVSLDARQERAQLASAEAGRDLARANLDRSRSLLDQRLIAQAEYDAVAAQYKQTESNANEIRATIERKTIRAPFAGVTGIRQVNLGQYVRSGDPIVPLQAVSTVFVNFAVPQQQVGSLRVGQAVAVTAEGAEDERFEGRINAINPVVDDATRNVQVQASLRNPGGLLRPGMYVTASVDLGARKTVVALPNSAINFAPYGNSVFIVESMKGPNGKPYLGVRQQFVKLGPARGDLVAVTDGVQAGQQVVTSGVFKLRTGAAVVVSNKVQPSASAAPRPEDS
jgi:membrane fusion protein (multidrug efflux system)